MKVPTDVLVVLEGAEIEGNILRITEKLERNLYQDVNKVLECLGGKWDRKVKGHVFSSDPTALIDDAMITGEVTDEKKEFQFFRTPPEIASRLVEMAEITPVSCVLEPSAGDGAIVKEIIKLGYHPPHCVELNPKNEKTLLELGAASAHIMDFLDFPAGSQEYDRIVANPPFTRQQDVDHVLHMYRLLRKGGILVSVMSPSWTFRDNKKSVEFRKFIEEREAEVVDLEAGAFKSSGTMIRTCIVKVRKPK